MKRGVVLIDLNTLNKTNFFVYVIFNELKILFNRIRIWNLINYSLHFIVGTRKLLSQNIGVYAIFWYEMNMFNLLYIKDKLTVT